MSMAERSRRRRARMRVHKANGFEDADRWDLEFWQSQTPAARLAALVALRRDVEKIHPSEHRD